MTESFLSASWYRLAQLKPRLHSHVSVYRHRYRGQSWYVILDHATGRVHRFTPAAYLLIGNMDGVRTLDDIWTSAAVQLEDSAPSQDEVVHLMSQLHKADLLQAGIPPEPGELLDRLSRQRWRLLGRRFKSPISMTVPLWDPDRFLTQCVGVLRAVPARTAALVWSLSIVAAAILALLHLSELTQNVSDRVLSANNIAMLAIVFPIVKLLHEAGHGYVVKAFGGAVHECGVMLLVFYPVPYMDASAALAFRSKYVRALVGAAGMMVEMFLAALATFVWAAAEDGIVKSVAFNVMLVAGFSTLLVNGNPLLRFDGYYILSDLLEIPNLAARANRYWGSLIERKVFGVQPAHRDVTLPSERKWLLAYAPLSFAYRMAVLFGIALFLASQYLALGIAVAIWSLVAAVGGPLFRIAKHLAQSPTLHDRRARAIATSAGALALALGLLLLVPAPMRTVGEGVVWLPEDAQVRAGTNGFVLRFLKPPGAETKAGDALVEIQDITLEAKREAQRYRVDELETRYVSERFVDQVRAELTLQELAAEKAELQRLADRAERLVLRSPRAGTFVAHNPLDIAGRWVTEGQVIGIVNANEPRVVRAVVTQDNIDLVRQRLRGIDAKIADRRSETYQAAIIREVPAAQNVLPDRALGTAGGGQIALDPRDSENRTALDRLFQFDVQLHPEPADILYGTRIYLRYAHDWEPIGMQIYRRLRQLFLSYFDA